MFDVKLRKKKAFVSSAKLWDWEMVRRVGKNDPKKR